MRALSLLPRRVRAGGVLIGALATLLAPSIASAHIELTQAQPAAGVQAEPPSEVSLTFSGPLDIGSRMQLLDLAGVPVEGVGSRIDTSNRSRLLGTLPFIDYGTYTVAYTSVSVEDGHEQRGFMPLVWGGATSLVPTPLERDPSANLQDVDLQISTAAQENGDLQWQAWVGAPDPSAVERVLFRFKPLSGGDPGEQYLDGTWSPDLGAYTVSNPLTLAGPWQLIVSVRRTGAPDDARATHYFSAS